MSRPSLWIFLDKLKRKLYLKHELKRLLLKTITKSYSLPLIYRQLALYQKSKINRKSALPQIVNRCVKTGRSNSVTKKTKYSRFVFRTESYKGNMPGFKRASW